MIEHHGPATTSVGKAIRPGVIGSVVNMAPGDSAFMRGYPSGECAQTGPWRFCQTARLSLLHPASGCRGLKRLV